MRLANAHQHAATLIDLLVDCGPLTSAEACTKLGWSKGRFTGALAVAREDLCPALGLTIPHPMHGPAASVTAVTCWGSIGRAYWFIAAGTIAKSLRKMFAA